MLVFAGRKLPLRGEFESAQLPQVPRTPLSWPGLAAWVVAGLVGVLVLSGQFRFGVISSMAFAVIALSFVILTGLLGQVSLAQAAIAGIGGFTLAHLGTSLPFPLPFVLAAVVAAVLGVLIGLPALRIRGAQLAVVTFAAASVVDTLVLLNPAVNDPTGGRIPSPHLGPIDFAVRQGNNIARWQFGLLALVVLTAAAVGVKLLINSRLGSQFLAVRSNERAAASVGIRVTRVKIVGLALSSALAGIGGALVSYSRGEVAAGSFTVFVGIAYLTVTYLGGIGRVSGALLAGLFAPLGLFYVVASEIFGTASWYSLLSGIGLMWAPILYPDGMAGAFGRWRRKKAAPAPDSPVMLELASEPVLALAAGGPASTDTLHVDALTVNYGGVVAVDGVTVELSPGRIVGLIGPNGAGKTSLVDAITGFASARGTVHLGSSGLDRRTPDARVRSGVVRTWQSVEPFTELTVRDNVLLGAAGDEQRTDAVLDAFGLAELGGSPPEQLSTGQQKLLGLARAIAARPAILLADEPAAGLDTFESAALGRVLRAIADSGVAVLLIEHDLDLVLSVCDDMVVLDRGRVLMTGDPAEVASAPEVIEAYIGPASSLHDVQRRTDAEVTS